MATVIVTASPRVGEGYWVLPLFTAFVEVDKFALLRCKRHPPGTRPL